MGEPNSVGEGYAFATEGNRDEFGDDSASSAVVDDDEEGWRVSRFQSFVQTQTARVLDVSFFQL